MDIRRKEIWIVNLESFLANRLSTPPYISASKAYPDISFPALLSNSQGLLDGLIWSLNDNPLWSKDAWVIIHGHLKRAHQRLMDVVQSYTASSDLEYKGLERNTKEQRKRVYQSCAAIQDVYLGFCAVDAALKASAFMQQKGIRELIESALPQLVCDYFPVLHQFLSPWLQEAQQVYQWLFWDLLRSWVQLRTIDADTHRRLEHYMRHVLKTRNAREYETLKKGSAGEVPGSDLAGMLSKVVTNGSSTVSSSSHLQTALTAENAQRTIRSFLNNIFPPRRASAYRHRCQHCGAPFDSDAAKNAHYRSHFHSNNVLRPDEKVVRLLNPSPDAFINHCGDYDKSGYYPKVTEDHADAYSSLYKGESKGAVQIRLRDAKSTP